MIDELQQQLIALLTEFICDITGESGGEVNQYTIGYTLADGIVVPTI